MPRESLTPLVTPAEPWARRADWASGRVKDESDSGSAGVGLAVGWMFVLFWFGGLSLFALILHTANARHPSSDTHSAYVILGLFENVAVSRWVTVMEAHWIADEVRGAIRAAGGALDE